MTSTKKTQNDPPYTLEKRPRDHETDLSVIDKKTKKVIGKIVDCSKFSDGPTFKIEWEDPYNFLDKYFLPRFDSNEKAASFLFNVVKAANICREKLPVNQGIIDYIRYEARTLRDQAEQIRSLARNITSKREYLRHFAEKFGINDLIWELGEDKEIEKFLNFTREGKDVPFFSEAELYELIGKEDARTVLALLEKFVKKFDVIQGSQV